MLFTFLNKICEWAELPLPVDAVGRVGGGGYGDGAEEVGDDLAFGGGVVCEGFEVDVLF